jgi:MOSC domain-containing protein YiiM
MYALKDLIAGYAQVGRVDWIGLRSVRRADVVSLGRVMIDESGLEGDHGRGGKRAVTMMQAEHLPVIGAMMGQGPVDPLLMRRNLIVSGINLSALKGRQIGIGEVVIEITTVCAPCSRMEETFGSGGYSAVRGHGGWCARVLTSGEVSVGDVVRPVD